MGIKTTTSGTPIIIHSAKLITNIKGIHLKSSCQDIWFVAKSYCGVFVLYID